MPVMPDTAAFALAPIAGFMPGTFQAVYNGTKAAPGTAKSK
jgi:hypothetical protein